MATEDLDQLQAIVDEERARPPTLYRLDDGPVQEWPRLPVDEMQRAIDAARSEVSA